MFLDSGYNARLRDLKQRLEQENPILTEVVESFRDLDQISRRLGFFRRDESYATRTSWWRARDHFPNSCPWRASDHLVSHPSFGAR